MYKLESGPEGMTVSPRGLVTWNVPGDLADRSVQAIVAVSNSAGKEILHSFTMQVREWVVVRSAEK